MRFSALFTLLVGVALADQPVLHDLAGYQKGIYGHQPSQTYRSSNITSPIFNYDTWRKDLVAGDDSSHILLALRYRGSGPYLFRNDDLSLVYGDMRFSTAMNARVQDIKGVKYLSFWHGAKFGGHGEGFCVFYDERYQLRYNLSVSTTGEHAIRTDLHECQLTSDGTVLMTAYEVKPFDLSPLGYSGNDVLADGCFHEVDIETNETLFSWCASEHFGVALTFQNHTGHGVTPPDGADIFHINSVQKTAEGHYLTSLRALKLVTYINGTSGKPIWNLGGKVNDFTDVTPLDVLKANAGSDGATSFGWQHDVRFLDEALTQIALFDNHNLTVKVGCESLECSRGRILQIDTTNPDNLTVQLVRDYRSPQGLISQVMGSMQAVYDPAHNLSNVLIGWGVNAEFTEHTLAGELARDVQFSPLDPRGSFGGLQGQSSYRVHKDSWYGYPPWAPNVTTDGEGTLWVSWNGATEVRSWAVLGSYDAAGLGSSQGTGYDSHGVGDTHVNLEPFHIVKRVGFETEFRAQHFWPTFVKLAALDSAGKVIGTSDTVEIPPALGCQLDCLALQSVLIR